MEFNLYKTSKQILELEIWIIGAAVGISVVSPRLLPWVFFLGLVLLFMRKLTFGDWGKQTPSRLGIGGVVLAAAVSLFASAWTETSLLQVYRLVSGIMLFHAIVNWVETYSQLRIVMLGVVLVGFLISIGAFFGVDWVGYKIPLISKSIYDRFNTFLADTANPNVMAGSLVILFPFAPSLILFSWKSLKSIEKLGAVVIACCLAFVILLTQSRGAIIALSAVFALLFVFRWRQGWLILLGSTIIGGLYFFLQEFVIQRFWIATLAGMLRMGDRVEIWSRAIFMIQDFPFTGIGMGTFRNVAELMYPLRLRATASVPHAHNLLLQIAVDIGVPGLIAWLSIFLVIIFISWNLFQHGVKTGDQISASIGVGLFCSMAALFVNGMTDSVTWGMVRPAPIVWAIWGFGIAAWNVYGRAAPESKILPSKE